jgi:hypothetical protein
MVVLSAADEELLQELRKLASDRVRLVTHPSICAALQQAVSEPEKLNPIERALLATVIPVPIQEPALLPISFSPPYSAFCGTENKDFNSLHPVGIAVWRCMAGLVIAEREGRLSRSIARCRDELVHGVIIASFARPGWSPMPTVTPREFVRLFSLVKENHILAEFTPPTLPDDAEWTPMIVPSSLPPVHIPLMERFYSIEELQATFGEVLT